MIVVMMNTDHQNSSRNIEGNTFRGYYGISLISCRDEYIKFFRFFMLQKQTMILDLNKLFFQTIAVLTVKTHLLRLTTANIQLWVLVYPIISSSVLNNEIKLYFTRRITLT